MGWGECPRARAALSRGGGDRTRFPSARCRGVWFPPRRCRRFQPVQRAPNRCQLQPDARRAGAKRGSDPPERLEGACEPRWFGRGRPRARGAAPGGPELITGQALGPGALLAGLPELRAGCRGMGGCQRPAGGAVCVWIWKANTDNVSSEIFSSLRKSGCLFSVCGCSGGLWSTPYKA